MRPLRNGMLLVVVLAGCSARARPSTLSQPHAGPTDARHTTARRVAAPRPELAALSRSRPVGRALEKTESAVWSEELASRPSLTLIHEHDAIGDWVTVVGEDGSELCMFDGDAREAVQDATIDEMCGALDGEAGDDTSSTEIGLTM